MAHSALTAVIGEALIDLVVGADGQVAARPGGGPYNTARTMARLGTPAVFAGPRRDLAVGADYKVDERLADDGGQGRMCHLIPWPARTRFSASPNISRGSGSLSSGRGSTAPLAIRSTAGPKLRKIAIEPVTVISSL